MLWSRSERVAQLQARFYDLPLEFDGDRLQITRTEESDDTDQNDGK